MGGEGRRFTADCCSPRDSLSQDSDLVLRTCVFGSQVWELPLDDYTRFVFPGAPPALVAEAREGLRPPETEVLIGGSALSASAIAALPPAERKRIRDARAAQLIGSLLACIDVGWAGGFLLLYSRVAPLLGDSFGCSLFPLAARLWLARTGGEPTATYVKVRTAHAEALQAAGRHREAAEVYRENIRLDRTPTRLYMDLPKYALLGDPAGYHLRLAEALSPTGEYEEAAVRLRSLPPRKA